jgi:phage N-6-adenine-methyltransferase
MIVNINIDNEFKGLIPPLTSDERQELERSLLAEGCRDALVLWGDTLIDGHNRFEICTRNNIPFKTVQKEFADRRSAIEWIILNQFGRRNLPAHERARLALRLKPVIAERAKEQQKQSGGDRKSAEYQETVMQKSAEPISPVTTREELAKLANVSHDTIAKVEKIEKSAPEPIIEASRKGEISVNAAYQVTKLEPEQQEEIAQRIEQGEKTKDVVQEVQKRPHVAFNSGNNEWYTPKEIIDAARLTMGHIDLDPASNEIAQKIVNAETYYTAETNGLDKTWNGNVWLNPPYASDLIGKFADKLVAERTNYRQAVVLVNNATETEWFRKIVSVSAAVCFPKGRVKFYMPDGRTGAPLQGQAIIYIGDESDKFFEVFSKVGWCAVVNGI